MSTPAKRATIYLDPFINTKMRENGQILERLKGLDTSVVT